MEAAASDGDLEFGDEAAMVLAELAAGPSRATREGKAVGKRKAAAKGKLPAAKTHKRKRSSTPAAAKTAVEKTAEEDTDEGKPSQRSSTPHSKQKHQSEYLPAEEYQVQQSPRSTVFRTSLLLDLQEMLGTFSRGRCRCRLALTPACCDLRAASTRQSSCVLLWMHSSKGG